MARPKKSIVQNAAYRSLAARFQAHLLGLGYHPRTSRSRYNYACEFLHWLEQAGLSQIEAVDEAAVARYYTYLSSRASHNKGGTLSPKTTHSHLRNIRELFEMLLRKGQIKRNPAAGLHVPYPKEQAGRSILSQQEVGLLYDACETLHERAILSMAYGLRTTGGRNGEM